MFAALAVVGPYRVRSVAAAERRFETGIRLALGVGTDAPAWRAARIDPAASLRVE